MAKKIRKITSQGHRVLGALATYLAPKMAADKALKPGELDSVIKSIKPDVFANQINGIVGTVNDKFKDRLAQDATLDPSEIKELMEAIEPFEDDLEELGEGGEEGEEGEDDDLGEGGEEGEDDDLPIVEEGNPGEKLMALLKECNIPEDKLMEMNELINKIATPKGGDEFPLKSEEEKPKGEFPPKKEDKPTGEFPPKKENEPMDKPQAMDAKTIEKNITTNIAARFAAAKEVLPFVGEVDPLAFDSADGIYQFALKNGGIETKDVHPSAFKSLLPLLTRSDEVRPAPIAMDAKEAKSLTEKYPHAPGLA